MAVSRKSKTREWFSDKTQYLDLIDEIDRKAGIVYDPTATPQKAREMMLADGIRPEDNLFSRDIIRVKYPDNDCNQG